MAARVQHRLSRAQGLPREAAAGDLLRSVAGEPVPGGNLPVARPASSTRSTAAPTSMPLINMLPSHKVLSLGVINGRNIWKTDLNAVLDWLEPLPRNVWASASGSRRRARCCTCRSIWPASRSWIQEMKSWLAYALQKLGELKLLATALNHGRESVKTNWLPTGLPSPRAALAARATTRRSRPRSRISESGIGSTQQRLPSAPNSRPPC
jgi:hypothetical protein